MWTLRGKIKTIFGIGDYFVNVVGTLAILQMLDICVS